jgi:F0F1-type ATP synthase assembly protein I
MSPKRSADAERRVTVALLGLGMEMCVAVLLVGGLGYGLDRYFGWFPVATICGLVLGVVYGFVNLIRTALKLTQR